MAQGRLCRGLGVIFVKRRLRALLLAVRTSALFEPRARCLLPKAVYMLTCMHGPPPPPSPPAVMSLAAQQPCDAGSQAQRVGRAAQRMWLTAAQQVRVLPWRRVSVVGGHWRRHAAHAQACAYGMLCLCTVKASAAIGVVGPGGCGTPRNNYSASAHSTAWRAVVAARRGGADGRAHACRRCGCWGRLR